MMDGSLLTTNFDNAEAPEYNIHEYLREAEVVEVDPGTEQALARMRADRFRAKDLQTYFVHSEVDKQSELDLNHFSLGEDETNML